MAGRSILQTTSTQMTLTNAWKTVLQLLAPASFCLAVHRVEVTFDNPNATDEMAAAMLLQQDQDGTGTTRAPVQYGPIFGSIQTTGKEIFSAEPTTNRQITGPYEITPQGGLIWEPPGGYLLVEPGKAFGLVLMQRTTATTNLKASAHIIASE